MGSTPTGSDPAHRSSEVTPESAAALCASSFFQPQSVTRLDAYRGANFRVEDGRGRRFTLKLSPAGEQDQALRLEAAALTHLEALGFPGVPRLIPSRRGRPVERLATGGGELDARLLTWVSGVLLASVERPASALLGDLGFYLASLDRALESLRPEAGRALDWDLLRLDQQRRTIPWLDEPADRALVERAVERFLGRHRALSSGLPMSLVHHDANDHNIVVSSVDARGAELVGLIDFGDLLVTTTVHELAIAAAYVAGKRPDPWTAIEPLVVGYDRGRRLAQAELELLYAAVCARLSQSMLMAAQRRREGSADDYALVSEHAARGTLRALSELGEDEVLDRLLSAVEHRRGRNDE